MRRWNFLSLLTSLVITTCGVGQELGWIIGADGLRYPEDLALYRQAGMTVLWVSVFYRPDGNFSDYDALLDAADKDGMVYIIALDLRPPPLLGSTFRCALHDANYLTWLRRWLDVVIPHFRHRPNLLGYALGRQVDETISYDDEGFALFLQNRYQTLEQLSSAWQLPVTSWLIPQQVAMQADDNLSPVRYGRPSLDAALYRWLTLGDLLALWAKEVRARDSNPKRPLVAGPLTTYRSLAVVPPDYQIVMPYLSPERAEADWLAHNAHAVAIARRGGRFRVLPMLTVRLTDGRLVPPEMLMRWVMAAVAQGASGFVLNDWSALKESNDLQVHVAAVSRRLATEIPLNATPIPKWAILYTPFGEGVMDRQGFPLYGFAQPRGNQTAFPLRLSLDEPAPLFFALRFHAWGVTDCLTPEELTPDFLSRYRVLFAPMPVYLDPKMQSGFVAFVTNGGTVVADFGVGAFQSEAPFQVLPPAMQELFGVTVLRRILFDPQLRTNMVVFQWHPLFPNAREGLELGNPLLSFGAIIGLTSGAKAQPWALLTTARAGKRVIQQEGRRRVIPGRLEIAAVFVNEYGRGYVIFAPTLLWAFWSPRDFGFGLFHGSLISRWATLTVAEGGFIPPVWVSEMDKGILVVNPTGEQQAVRLHLRSPIFYAFNEGVARPLPTFPAAQEILLSLRPNDWLFLRPVAEVSPPTAVQVVQLSPDRITFRLDPNPNGFTSLGLLGNFYRTVAPHHQVTIESVRGKHERIVQPDQWGSVIIERIPVPATVTVAPVQ